MKVKYIPKNIHKERFEILKGAAPISFKGNLSVESISFSYSDVIYAAISLSPIFAGMFIYRGIKKAVNSKINKFKTFKDSFFKGIQHQALFSFLKSSCVKIYKGAKEKIKNFSSLLKTKWKNFKKPS